MTELIQIITDGLLLGGVYAIAAIGLSMVFGIMDVVNLAHGHFLMIGGYIAVLLLAMTGLTPLVGMLLAMLLLFVLGIVLHHVLLRHVIDAGMEQPILVLFGVALIFENLVEVFIGSESRLANLVYFQGGIEISGVYLSVSRLLTFTVALMLVLLTWVFVNQTSTGRAIQATAQNRVAAKYMGIDTERVNLITMGIGTALAGAAGALLSTLFPVDPFVGWSYLLTTFAVVVLGGVGSIGGTLVAGLLLGVAENLGAFYIGGQYRNVIVFTIFLGVLLVRPRGLFGTGMGEQ